MNSGRVRMSSSRRRTMRRMPGLDGKRVATRSSRSLGQRDRSPPESFLNCDGEQLTRVTPRYDDRRYAMPSVEVRNRALTTKHPTDTLRDIAGTAACPTDNAFELTGEWRR